MKAVGYMEIRAELEAKRQRAAMVQAGTRLLFTVAIIIVTAWLTR